MARIESFSIPDEDEEIYTILKAKKKDRNLSHWLCKAIRNQVESEQTKKIENYLPEQTELDFAPKVTEPIPKSYLRTLSEKDIGKLHRMIYWNKELLDNWVKGLNRSDDTFMDMR